MSHRDHAQGATERGNDWLDGALAGWLLFITISMGPYLLALRDGVTLPGAVFAAAPVLALAAIFPLLRFHRVGWFLALVVLGLMVAHEVMDLAAGERLRSAPVFLAVHLLGLGYLLWIIPEFWPRDAAGPALAPESPAFDLAEPEASGAEPGPVAPAPAQPTPVTHALAAIHHRIVAAGSACAVAPVAVRAEAGRFGVTPASLRTEGLALYRTFLQHFLSDGPLNPDEERELICLERALDLDDDGVWRMRAEAGLLGGAGSPAPILTVLNEALPESIPAAAVDGERPAPTSLVDRTLPPAEEAGVAADDSGEPPPVRTMDADASSAAETELPAEEAGATHDEAEFLEMDHAGLSAGGPDGLADYEEHELGALLAWAGIPSLPEETPRRAALERLRALHRTSTEPLEACASDHPLEAGESCLAIRTVELYRVPPGAAPADAPADVPGPVLEPRALVDGALETDRDLAGFQRTGVCRFVLTERRLLLVAPSGQNSPLPVSRVRAVRPFRNGLEVRPQRGSPVFLAFTGGVDDVAMRIDRAARDLRARA